MRWSRIYRILFISLLICILISIIIRSHKSKEGFETVKIPKIIWTYWDKKELPPVVQKCIDSWKKYNPDYEVRIVNSETLKTYIDVDLKSIKWNDSPARESDIIRLNILAEYGGVWSDATIFMTEPMNLPEHAQTEVIAYYLDGVTSDKRFPVIESWFFATIPNGNFITKWRDAFMNTSSYPSIDAYLDDLKANGVDMQKISLLNYLLIHACAQYVLQKELTIDEIVNTMVFMKAEDGPFKYLTVNEWDSYKAIESLCRGETVAPIIKFRGGERDVLDKNENLQKCVLDG